jgi:photosystem II stability/assembly factor-like uncharacterized protein
MILSPIVRTSVVLLSLLALSSPVVRSASVPHGDDWQIAGPFGGTATAVAIDPKNPQILLAGARESLLYSSHDGGNSWAMLPFPKRPFGEVHAILIDPQDSNHYFVGLGGSAQAGLFESENAGRTWASVLSLSGFSVQALAASASNPDRFVAGTMQGVYLSADSGKTWTRISDPNNLEMLGITAVAVDPKNPDIMYAGTTHLPWKTTDGGKTWRSIHNGMIDDSDVFSIHIDQQSPDQVFASACSGIYRSGNRGDEWRKLMGIPNTHRRTHVVRQDPNNPATIYAGTTLGLFKSMDGGATWNQVNHQQVNSLTFDPAEAGAMVLALEDDGLWRSNEHGDVLKPVNNGFVARRLSAVTVSGKRLYAIESMEGTTTGVFTSENGQDWKQVENTSGLEGIHLDSITGVPGDENILYATSPRELFKTTDSGMTWRPVEVVGKFFGRKSVRVRTARGKYTKRQDIIEHTVHPTQFFTVRAAGTDEKPVLYAATDRGLLVSTDKGLTWLLADTGAGGTVQGVYTSPGNDGGVVARGNNRLYLSEDFGETWKSLSFPMTAAQIHEVAVPPAKSSAPLLVATSQGLYATRDRGQSWKLINSGIPVSTVESVIYSATQTSTAYAVEFGQLYQSKDGAATWRAVPSSFQSLRIRQLWQPAQLPDQLFAVTNDIGILFRNQAFIR